MFVFCVAPVLCQFSEKWHVTKNSSAMDLLSVNIGSFAVSKVHHVFPVMEWHKVSDSITSQLTIC
jgi:hypothetical protein